MNEDVSLTDLVEETENYTGAEIAGLCRSATSYALNREIDLDNQNKKPDETKICIFKTDFERALGESKPAFGKNENLLRLCDKGIIPFNHKFVQIHQLLLDLTNHIQNLKTDGFIKSVLIKGDAGSGKTALISSIAHNSKFSFVNLITPRKLMGMNDISKVAAIDEIFNNAYKTDLAIIMLDDIEIMLDYVIVGNSVRFSNHILQALFMLLKERPPTNCKLLVLVTTSSIDLIDMLNLDRLFTEDNTFELPYVQIEDCQNFDMDQLTKDVFLEKIGGNKAPIKKIMELIDKLN
jgi:vesicle-fusing ATPase